MKSVLTRQDEDGISETELKIEEKEVLKEPPSILDSSDLTKGLPADFWNISVLKRLCDLSTVCLISTILN